MVPDRPRTNPTLFKLMIGAISLACFALAAAVLLAPLILEKSSYLPVMAILLGLALLRTLIAALSLRWAGDAITIPFIGRAQGSLIGLGVGGILGSRIAGPAGAIIGAIGLFLAGRFVGSALTTQLSALLRRYVNVEEPGRPTPRQMRGFPPAFYLSIPVLLMSSAILFRAMDLDFGNTLASNPTVQVIALAYTFVTLSFIPLLAWTFKKRRIPNTAAHFPDPEVAIFHMSMGLATIPSAIGLVLFVMGAPLSIVAVFAAISFSTMITITIRNRSKVTPAA